MNTDTATITFTDGHEQVCTLADTSSVNISLTSGSQTLSVTSISGTTVMNDLATVASIAFSLTPVSPEAPEADTSDSPSDTTTNDTTSTDTVQGEQVEPTEPSTDAPAPETTEEPANQTVAPTEVDVTNGEEIVINETDAPVVPEMGVE